MLERPCEVFLWNHIPKPPAPHLHREHSQCLASTPQLGHPDIDSLAQVLSGLLQLFGSTGRTRSHCYRGESADLSQYLRRAPTQLDYLSQKTMVSRSPLQCQSPMSEETRVVNSQC